MSLSTQIKHDGRAVLSSVAELLVILVTFHTFLAYLYIPNVFQK